MESNPAASVATIRSRRLTAPRDAFRVFLYVVVVVGGTASLFPLFWTFVSAGKDIPEMFTYPPTFLPRSPDFIPIYASLFADYPSPGGCSTRSTSRF